MFGTNQAMPIKGGFYPKKIRAKFGEPIYINQLKTKLTQSKTASTSSRKKTSRANAKLNSLTEHELARQITDQVMLALQKISEQDYNPKIYGSVVRKQYQTEKLHSKVHA
jgi:hypothetical protein